MKLKINIEKCKGCQLCVAACPKDVLEISKSINKRGQQYIIVKCPDKCTGCSLCAIMCPDCAIEIVEGEK